jgi:hypothetical protein
MPQGAGIPPQATLGDPEKSKAVRAWAAQRGLEISGMGRVPDRYTASYRLEAAGRSDLLSADDLLAEAPVAAWAQQEGHRLGVRNRVTSELWLNYAHHHLAPEADPTERP